MSVTIAGWVRYASAVQKLETALPVAKMIII